MGETNTRSFNALKRYAEKLETILIQINEIAKARLKVNELLGELSAIDETRMERIEKLSTIE